MANAIQIKRRASSGSAGAPSASSLRWGELAFNEADNILYYGYGSGNNEALSVKQIGGSGYFADRGGTNASGLWPIAVTGNAGSVTNGVYTTGNQTIDGIKVFDSGVTLSDGNPAHTIKLVYNGAGVDSATIYADTDNEILHLIYKESSIYLGTTSVALNRASASQTLNGVSIDGNAGTSNQIKTQSSSTNASHYLTFVDSNNGSATAETLYTDSEIYYNPSNNTLNVGTLSTTGNVTIGGDLVVQGTTTTVNSTEVEIGDNIITVNASGLSTGGFRVKDATGNYQSLIWNESNSQWEFQGDTANIYTSGTISLTAGSTTSIGWVPVFDGGSAPDVSPNEIKYITRENFLSDLGIASSGTQVIAGDGLTGGGTLESNITLNVGSGDGISVTANAVAVDNTVVRTTGDQTIGDLKNFNQIAIFPTGTSPGGRATLRIGHGTDYYYDFYSGVGSTASGYLLAGIHSDTSSAPFRVVINNNAGTSSITNATWDATTIAVNKGGTGQTSYTNGQLLIGNTTGNTLTKATLSSGTAIDITNGAGSITIAHADTSTISGAQGGNGIAGFTIDGLGHITAVTTATYLTAGTVCAAIADCGIDGGTF